MLQTYVVFHKHEYSMVLVLGPGYILQTGFFGFHTLARIHIPCHQIFSLAQVTGEIVNHLRLISMVVFLL
jgi:hypothetical protein